MNTLTQQLAKLFPEESAIPLENRLNHPIHQREMLIDGEMIPWEGTVQEVYSPVYVQTDAGLQRLLIGSYPLAGQAEADAALEAAVHAF